MPDLLCTTHLPQFSFSRLSSFIRSRASFFPSFRPPPLFLLSSSPLFSFVVASLALPSLSLSFFSSFVHFYFPLPTSHPSHSSHSSSLEELDRYREIQTIPVKNANPKKKPAKSTLAHVRDKGGCNYNRREEERRVG